MPINSIALALSRARSKLCGRHYPAAVTIYPPWVRLGPAVFGLLALSACATAQTVESGVVPRPLGRDLPSFQLPDRSDAALYGSDADRSPENLPSSAEFTTAPTGSLNLQEALAVALMNNPELAAFAWDIRAADARVLQASLRPNPEFAIEAENFSGSGVYSGLSATEYTAMLSQPILTGGEIAKRTRVAELERGLALWDYEAKRLDVFTEVVQRFVDVLAAQRRRAVAEQTFELAEQVYQTVVAQVTAGAVSPIEQTRAGAERALNQVNLRRAEHAQRAARIALAETLGLSEPSFDTVAGKLRPVQPIPPLQVLDDLLAQNPAIARWETALNARRAEIELAEAEGIPDVTAGIGIRHFQEFGDTAAVLSFSVPLPLFDRNQGNIGAARAELNQARWQSQSAVVRVHSELGQRYQQLQAAQEAATGLVEQALPAARSAYEAVRTAYQRGERGFLDVLIAQRTLFEVEARHIDALADYHRTKAAVERLIARPLEEVSANDVSAAEFGVSAEEGDTK